MRRFFVQVFLSILLLTPSVTIAAEECNKLMNQFDRQSTTSKLSFYASGETEQGAIFQAKQRIAESISLSFKVSSSEKTTSKGNSQDGVQSNYESEEQVNVEKFIDISLPQPSLIQCANRGENYYLAKYSIPLTDLVSPSVQALERVRSGLKRFSEARANINKLSILLDVYDDLSIFELRSGYKKYALRQTGFKPSKKLTWVKRKLNTLLKKITVNQNASAVLKPTEVTNRYQFSPPVQINVFLKEKALRNQSFLFQYEGGELREISSLEGKILLNEVLLKEKKESRYDELKPKQRVALTKRQCPSNISFFLLSPKGYYKGRVKSFSPSCFQYDQYAFEETKRTNSISSYGDFLSSYQSSRYFNQAANELYQLLSQSRSYEDFKQFLTQFPNSKVTRKVEQKFYQFLKEIDLVNTYGRFLKDFPESRFRNSVEKLLFNKIKSLDSFEEYAAFAKENPNFSKRKQLLNLMLSKALQFPENDLKQKESKLDKLKKINSIDSSYANNSIKNLEESIAFEIKKQLSKPETEDDYLLTMRTAHVSNQRFTAGLDATKLGGGEFIPRIVRYAIGYEQTFGLVLGANYDQKWAQPVREVYANLQARIFGSIEDEFSISLGAARNINNDDVELNSEEQGEDLPKGTDKDGKSQFSNQEDETEAYLTAMFKYPSISSFFHFYLGSVNSFLGYQYFLNSNFSLIAEGMYRHQAFKVQERDGDSSENKDFEERENQAKELQSEFSLGIALGSELAGDALQTKLYYSVVREEGLLTISIPW